MNEIHQLLTALARQGQKTLYFLQTSLATAQCHLLKTNLWQLSGRYLQAAAASVCFLLAVGGIFAARLALQIDADPLLH
jgi:hypothetical protein